jgi:hypothetical protein
MTEASSTGINMRMIIVLILLAISLYFLAFRVLKTYITKVRIRRLLSVLSAVFFSPVLYFGIVFLMLFVVSYYPKKDFDRERWVSQTELRYEMTDDIIEGNLLIGKSKSEIEGLLGLGGNSRESDLWKYNVGYVPSMISLDPDFLFVRFENGKAHEVYQQ